ncbi:MAG: hypothetical protein M1823_006055 [Watsoniomyces obsoletus]|nr:MAG: hypothetical protein M1823_006055 [Watsoniomyces obsoletus]
MNFLTSLFRWPSSPRAPWSSSRPFQNCKEAGHTVIVGGGVIGFSTAYYLARSAAEDAMNGDKVSGLATARCITVVDSSATLFQGASGQATGILGDYGFGPETMALGELSFQLHQDLAQEHYGRRTYGFAGIKIHHEEEQFSQPRATTGGNLVLKDRDRLHSWLRVSKDLRAELIADRTHAGRLDPRKFCHWLRRECESRGVRVMLNTQVTKVQMDREEQTIDHVTLRLGDSQEYIQLPCRNLVLSAGPWSDRVFSSLFPHASVSIPMNVTAAAGNHLLIRTPGWKPDDDDFGCDQVYLDEVLDDELRLDLSTFLSGTLYVGGYGAMPQQLPDKADQVKPQPKEIEAMKRLVAQWVRLDEGESLQVLDTGRCYRPRTTLMRPIITKVPWHVLFRRMNGIGHADRKLGTGNGHGGVFVNTGHDSDGITLGPGSGKVMAELIRGVPTSVDISQLDLLT